MCRGLTFEDSNYCQAEGTYPSKVRALTLILIVSGEDHIEFMLQAFLARHLSRMDLSLAV